MYQRLRGAPFAYDNDNGTKGFTMQQLPPPDPQVIKHLMVVATDLQAILARVASDRAFTTELVKAQIADDESSMERLLHSTGSTAALRIDGPPPGQAAAKIAMPKETFTVNAASGPNGTTWTVGGSISFRFGGPKTPDGPGPIGPPVLSPTIPEKL